MLPIEVMIVLAGFFSKVYISCSLFMRAQSFYPFKYSNLSEETCGEHLGVIDALLKDRSVLRITITFPFSSAFHSSYVFND